ncbi:ester cyclase [Deinococcus yavapaiensis]|uniref:Putative ester cyclase n=1 Tax=Deinococcus yavapaiensis KR-236 TaxID=694435 RepID=A0A318SKB7_9DEIO|nr:ester cyclase [Deinococcus yavapaiensis]PYE54799.1 putative ester cyclase [Deinococcus yavapaiensis KR-236]
MTALDPQAVRRKLTPSEMKARMVYIYDETNKGNLAVFEELFAPEFVSYGGAGFGDLHGPAAFRDLYQQFLVGMPDLRIDSTFMVAEGDIVFVRGTLTGTHSGDFMGVAPTNKRIEWTGTAVFKFGEQGLCVARWQEWDGLSVLQQLGVIPTPPNAPTPNLSHAPEADPTAADVDAERVNANRALMRRFIQEVWNEGNMDVADEIFAPNATSPDAPGLPDGPQGVKIIAQMFRSAFPDYHMEIDLIAAEGDRVAAHFIQTGTHQGELMGIPASGRTVRFGEMGLLRLENGQVVESFYNPDMLTLMQQLGVGGNAPASGA